MLSSITPLGLRGRGMSWTRAVVAFSLAAVLTAIGLFGLLGWLGDGLAIADSNSLVVVGIIGTALVLDLAGIRPPGPQRQVNEDWLGRYRDWVIGAGFGAQLGLGFVTIVPTFGVLPRQSSEQHQARSSSGSPRWTISQSRTPSSRARSPPHSTRKFPTR